MSDIYSRTDRLFEAAFSSVHPANIFTQAHVRLPEPFHADPAMPHYKPVRYPDLNACPLQDPDAAGVRFALLVETVQRTTADDPSPMDVDNMGTGATVPTLNLGTDALSKEELFRRAFVPQTTLAVPTGRD